MLARALLNCSAVFASVFLLLVLRAWIWLTASRIAFLILLTKSSSSADVFFGGTVPFAMTRWSVWQTSQLPRASNSPDGGVPGEAGMSDVPWNETSNAAALAVGPSLVLVMRCPTAPM